MYACMFKNHWGMKTRRMLDNVCDTNECIEAYYACRPIRQGTSPPPRLRGRKRKWMQNEQDDEIVRMDGMRDD